MRKKFVSIGLAVICATVLVVGSVVMASMPEKVIANVTTNDVNKAAMAIKFTHGIMKKKGMQATLFFNVYGVELVNRNLKSPMYPSGESIAQMLDAFMKDGGTVIACPMCMKNVGHMTNADLLPGVAAREGMGLEAVTQPDTLVLSY